MTIKTTEGFINLFTAVMELAYKDAESKDEKLKAEATEYIETMKKNFS